MPTTTIPKRSEGRAQIIRGMVERKAPPEASGAIHGLFSRIPQNANY